MTYIDVTLTICVMHMMCRYNTLNYVTVTHISVSFWRRANWHTCAPLICKCTRVLHNFFFLLHNSLVIHNCFCELHCNYRSFNLIALSSWVMTAIASESALAMAAPLRNFNPGVTEAQRLAVTRSTIYLEFRK